MWPQNKFSVVRFVAHLGAMALQCNLENLVAQKSGAYAMNVDPGFFGLVAQRVRRFFSPPHEHFITESAPVKKYLAKYVDGRSAHSCVFT